MSEVSQVLSTSSSQPPAAPAWNEGLPEPKTQAEGISAETIARLIKDPAKVAGDDFIVVDLRKADFEDAVIRGAINLPANSFYQTLEGVLAVLSHIPQVIFHCRQCAAPKTRGQKCAAYYQDALDAKGVTTSKAYFLEGGIKGWIELYAGDAELTVKL